MKKRSPSGKKIESALKKWATCRPSGCQCGSRSLVEVEAQIASDDIEFLGGLCGCGLRHCSSSIQCYTNLCHTIEGLVKRCRVSSFPALEASHGVLRSGWMTIENLSLRSGVTTRNIRAYQSRGLLPAAGQPDRARAPRSIPPEHLAKLPAGQPAAGPRLLSGRHRRPARGAGDGKEHRAGARSRIGVDRLRGRSSRVWLSESGVARAAADGARSATRRSSGLIAVGLVDRHRNGSIASATSACLELGARGRRTQAFPLDALLDEFVRLRSDLHEIALRFVGPLRRARAASLRRGGNAEAGPGLIVERMKHLRQLAVEASDALMRQAIADEIETVARAALPNYPAAPPGRSAK